MLSGEYNYANLGEICTWNHDSKDIYSFNNNNLRTHFVSFQWFLSKRRVLGVLDLCRRATAGALLRTKAERAGL